MAFRMRVPGDDAQLTALWTAQQPSIAAMYAPVAVPASWPWGDPDLEVFVSTDAQGVRAATVSMPKRPMNVTIRDQQLVGDAEVVLFWRQSLTAANLKLAVKDLWGTAARTLVAQMHGPAWRYWAMFPAKHATIKNLVDAAMAPHYVVVHAGELPGFTGGDWDFIWLDMATIGARVAVY